MCGRSPARVRRAPEQGTDARTLDVELDQADLQAAGGGVVVDRHGGEGVRRRRRSASTALANESKPSRRSRASLLDQRPSRLTRTLPSG
jgi:hypothetical protein